MVTLRRIIIQFKDNVTMVVAGLTKKKLYWACFALVLTILFLYTTEPEDTLEENTGGDRTFEELVRKWSEERSSMRNLSKLGEVLFQEAKAPSEHLGTTYQILVWKYGPTIENRHLKNFANKKLDPFEHCPVKNCNLTYADSAIDSADLVLFHLHRIKGVQDLPLVRKPEQIWAFLTDESPLHTFMESKNQLKDFNGIFNWSMTYRSDSDIPVPYGRTVLRKPPVLEERVVPTNKRRDVLVAVMGSNCGGQNHRWQYVKKLSEYLKVDVYGGCGTSLKKKCPGHFTSDCKAIEDYMFYLAFENSNCDEYITEKLWWNAYHKNSIPILMGASVDSYKKLLPIDSYLNVEQFANPSSLAEYILSLNETGAFAHYYKWKSHFKVLNEHGYFQSPSYHYCRICQALNYNSKNVKVYDDLESYWKEGVCHKAWDVSDE